MKDKHKTIKEILDSLPAKDRKEAISNIVDYLKMVKKISDNLSKEDRAVLLIRSAWEKRLSGRSNVSQK